MHGMKEYTDMVSGTCTGAVHILGNMHKKTEILCTSWTTCIGCVYIMKSQTVSSKLGGSADA